MWDIKSKSLVISVLLAFMLLSASAIQIVKAQEEFDTQNVIFTTTNPSVSGTFGITVSSPMSPKVVPGEKLDIELNLTGATSLELDYGSFFGIDLGNYGLDIETPIGTVTESVTESYGIYDAYFTSSLSSSLSISGPGTLSANTLNWSSLDDTKIITVDAANAENGDSITITLDLEYNVTVSSGTMGILYINETLGTLDGTPSVTITIDVKKSSNTIAGLDMMTITIIIVVVLVITVVGGVFAMKKKKTKMQPPLEKDLPPSPPNQP